MQENKQNIQTFEYAAFVSYRHNELDKTWAKWVVQALEVYKVPKHLRERGFPAKVGKLYRDEDEAHAGVVLGDHIAAALDQSRSLIIVCTHSTQDSPWVEREIAYFRSIGRGDRIFCLLAEGHPGTSFPKSLLETNQNRHDALGGESAALTIAADVRPSRETNPKEQKRLAALRLISGILGCRFDELRQRDLERERHRKLVNWIVTSVVLLAIGISGLWYWDQSRSKTAYFSNISTQWGQPVGVGQIDSDTYDSRALAYQLQSTWAKVRTVVRKGPVSYDVPLTPPFSSKDAFSWEFIYREDGELDEITARDRSGIIVRRDQYNIDRSGRSGGIQYTRKDGAAISPIPVDDLIIDENVSQRSTGITRNRLVFDDNGRILFVKFQNPFSNHVPDATGGLGIAYTYSSDGLIKSRTRINKNAQRLVARGKPSVSFYHYQSSQLSERWIEDGFGNMVIGSKKYAKVKIERDLSGNITDFVYLNANGKPTLKSGKYTRYQTKFNSTGLRILQAYFGKGGKRVRYKIPYDFHRAEYRYKNKYLVEEKYFNEKNELGPVWKGYSIHRRVNNSSGLAIEHSYHNEKGELKADNDGHAIYQIVRDKKGRLIKEYYRDTQNRLTTKSDKYPFAYYKREYSNEKDWQDYRFSPDGKRVNSREGFHSRKNLYDEFGRWLESFFFDVNLKPCNCRNGYHRQKITYDKFGNWEKSEFFSTDGVTPIAHKDGHEVWRAKYDERGLRISQSTMNKKGKYVRRNKTGVGYTEYQYDKFGRRIEIRYYSAPNKPVNHRKYGYHRSVDHYSNDPDTRPQEVRFFDRKGKNFFPK